MNPSTPPRASRGLGRGVHALAAGLVAIMVWGLAAAPAAAEPAAAPTVDLVDASATPETRSLFAFLRETAGTGTLFGHQHATDYGDTFATRDGVSADVKAATGDYPAVFGFDTLIIEGGERPGVYGGDRTANAHLLAQAIQEAHDLGAISTLSAHIENFVTGGNFNDLSGDALRAALPGGATHADLVAYLDLVALAALNAVDESGDPIPIIFRPWHENAGSWFWWGAAFGTPGEYAELYRFTVEYLRDVKGVHNLLYAFSPGSGFSGSAEQYLRTYPGDDFIDVLGYDAYDASASQQFLDSLVADLGVISDLAEARGKVAALTEIGITGGVRADGSNANTTWYTDVLDAIKADPRASRMAYLLTWANFGGGLAPYTPTSGELLPDFQAFAADPFTLFASDLHDVYDIETDAAPAAPTVHLVSPADGARVASSPATIRASVQGVAADRVFVEVQGGGTVELSAPTGGGLWWTGTWEIPASDLTNATRALTLHVQSGGVDVRTVTSSAVVGPRPSLPAGVVDDFEGYGDDTALRSEYVQYQANTIRLESGSVGGGAHALRLDYSFATQSYTGIGKQTGGDWSQFGEFQAWIDPDASGNKLVLQLVADGVAYEAYPSLAGDTPYLAKIPFADWRPAPWDTGNQAKRLNAQTLAKVSQFNVYVNAVEGGATAGSVVVDELRAVAGPPPKPVYADVAFSNPDYAAIAWLHDVYDLGDSKGRFQPSRVVTPKELRSVVAAYLPGNTATLPKTIVDRLSFARVLWQLAGSPEPEKVVRTYLDVAAKDRKAVSWVLEQKLVPPTITKHWFGTLNPVTRVQLARWLFAYDAIPEPVRDVVLFDFADGQQGWDIASWQTGGDARAANGRLIVEPDAAGSWISWSGGLDLTGRTGLVIDLPATTGVDVKAALQLGSSWQWCETAQTGWVSQPRTGTDALVVDLTTLSPECQALLGEVRGINLYLNSGAHEIDTISAR